MSSRPVRIRSCAVGALLGLVLASDAARAEPSADGEPTPEAVLAALPFESSAEPRRILIDLAPKGNTRRLRFLDPARYEVPASVEASGEAVLPLKIASNRPALRASVDDHAVDLLIDTGAPWGLMLSGEVARAAGIEFAPLPDFVVRGTVGNTAGQLGDARFDLGPFAFEQVPVLVAPNGFYNLGFPGDSILGYDVLAQFLVRIDYPRQRIWLRRDGEPKPFIDPRREAKADAR